MANFNFNKVILGGRLTADPELKTTQSGKDVTTFNIAINRKSTTDGQQEADFITCTAWEKQAEFVTKFFKKGSCICVVGSLRNRSYTTQDNQKRTVTEVLVSEVCFVDGKSESTQQAYSSPSQVPQSAYVPQAYMSTPAPNFEEIAIDEELPF